MTLVITLSKTELSFKDIFVRLIKPFNLVIGDKDLVIAYKVFDRLKEEFSEVIDVLKNDYDITVVFKRNVKLSKRKKILLYAVKELKRAYEDELGPVAKRMIFFALKDMFVSLNLPLNAIT